MPCSAYDRDGACCRLLMMRRGPEWVKSHSTETGALGVGNRGVFGALRGVTVVSGDPVCHSIVLLRDH